MKRTFPAITPEALAVAAGRKTRRVQKKLHEAENEIHSANQVLAHPRQHDGRAVRQAVERSSEAERKVHEAVEDLEVVKAMLEHTDPTHGHAPGGKTGAGVKSLLPHLRRHG